MSRPKKESVSLNIKIDINTATRLEQYCEESGLTKTAAVERSINLYVDEYDENMRALKKNR